MKQLSLLSASYCRVYAPRKKTPDSYDAFVAKFGPKRTTDDCFTPEPVYEAVADYVATRYGLDKRDFVRPFWPGGDYIAHEYGEKSVNRREKA